MIALIADDNPDHAEILNAQLFEEDCFQRVGIVTTIKALVEAVSESCPDVVFLDLEFPEANALEMVPVLHRAGTRVIIVTAYPNHAVRAFELATEDFLVKPVLQERLRESIERVRKRIRDSRRRPRQYLSFHSDGLMRSVHIDCIRSLAIVDTHTRIELEDRRSFQSRETLHSLLEKVPETASLIRISRHQAINLDQVREVKAEPNGTLQVILSGGTAYHCTRRRTRRFLKKFYRIDRDSPP